MVLLVCFPSSLSKHILLNTCPFPNGNCNRHSHLFYLAARALILFRSGVGYLSFLGVNQKRVTLSLALGVNPNV